MFLGVPVSHCRGSDVADDPGVQSTPYIVTNFSIRTIGMRIFNIKIAITFFYLVS